jgi:predicted transcriptional regulator
MPSHKGQGKRGVDAAALRSIAAVIEAEYGKEIKDGEDGWYTIETIAEELGITYYQCRDRLKVMVNAGKMETKRTAVRDKTGRLYGNRAVYRAIE